MSRVIGFLAAMLIFSFSARAQRTSGVCNTFGHEDVGRTAGAIGAGAGLSGD